MATEYDDLMKKAQAAAEEEQWQDAFGNLRWAFREPELPDNEDRFVEAVDLLASVGGAIAGDEFRELGHAAAQSPRDPETLYALGFELCEHQLYGIAACVLTRAHHLAPGTESIVAELAHALECDGQNAAACSVLVSEEALLAKHNIFRYLLAFNSLMGGDLQKAREVLPSLERGDNDSRMLANRIQGMLHRADVVEDVCTLDSSDLRGWHFVINGGFLLHLSRFGFDEGMNGRYGFTQDSPERCRDGILRLRAALNAANIRPKRVVSLPDRESQVLSTAAAKILALDMVKWNPRIGIRKYLGPQKGLVIGYDLRNQTEETLTELGRRHPSQHLFVHAACWTEPPPVCPDSTTYLYQANVSPWGERISVDLDSRDTRQIPPDDRSIDELASDIVSAREEENTIAADSRDALLATAPAMLAAISRSGERERFWQGGPVKSSQFF